MEFFLKSACKRLVDILALIMMSQRCGCRGGQVCMPSLTPWQVVLTNVGTTCQGVRLGTSIEHYSNLCCGYISPDNRFAWHVKDSLSCWWHSLDDIGFQLFINYCLVSEHSCLSWLSFLSTFPSLFLL